MTEPRTLLKGLSAAVRGDAETAGAGKGNTTDGLTRCARTRSLGLSAGLLALLLALPVAAYAAAPTFSKSFSPSSISGGGVSKLTFTITNGDASAVTGMAFTDPLPAGVSIANSPNLGTSCSLGGDGRTEPGSISAPAGGSVVSLGGGQLGANSTCTISLDVTSFAAGTHTNVSGDLTSSAGNSGNATATLTVDAYQLPVFSKRFAPASVSFGGTSRLTFTIDNSASNTARSQLTFADTLPVGMVVASPANATTACSGGLITADPGSRVISYRPLFTLPDILAAGASCVVSVDVTATATGTLINTSGELTTSPQYGGLPQSSGTASAVLQVSALGDTYLTKSFTDDPVAPGGSLTLAFSITNNDRVNPVSNISFSDDLEATLSGLVADGLPANDVCGDGSQLSGTSVVSLSGGTLAPGASCSFSVTLRVPSAAQGGTYLNTTSPLGYEILGDTTTGDAATDNLLVEAAPLLTKNFVNDPVGAGDSVVLEFTVTNTHPTASAGDIGFEDVFDVILPTASDVPGADFCGVGSTAVFTPLANPPAPSSSIPARLVISGASLAAGASCTFSITLDVATGAATGGYLNTTSSITATLDGAKVSGDPASDLLEVVAGPTLSKEFTDDPVQSPGTVTLQFTLSHDENAPGDASGIGFTDDLDASLSGLVATGLPADDVCGAGSQISGTTTLAFSGGVLAAGESCSFGVNLQVPAGVPAGTYTNTTSNVVATVSGISVQENPASAELRIAGLTLSKQFTNDPVLPGGSVDLQFTIDNLTLGSDATDILFTDDLDANLVGLAATGLPLSDVCGTGSSLTGASGDSFLVFQDGSLSAGDSCSFSVTLDVPAGATADTYLNTTSSLSATMDGSTVLFDNARDELTVSSSEVLSLAKSFTDDPVAPGEPVTLAFTLTNLNQANSVSDIAFTDDLDAVLPGLVATGVPISDCSGTVSAGSAISLVGGSLAAGASCSIEVSLAVPADVALGTVATNITSEVTGSVGGVEVIGEPAIDELRIDYLTFSKSFEGVANPGGTAVLSFTIENLSTTAGVTGISFTDDLDATLPGLEAIDTPARGDCGAGSVLDGTSLLTFDEGSLLPGGSCTVKVSLQVPEGTAIGTYLNTTSELLVDAEPVVGPATASLVVQPAVPCEIRTDYDESAGCSGTFKAFSVADLEQYVATDFGRDRGSNYMNLKLMADLTSDYLDIESPCSISLLDNVELSAGLVSLDGRRGVLDDNGYTINAVDACVLSERENAGLGAGSVVNAENLTIQSAKAAKIGLNSTVNVAGDLSIVSDGTYSGSTAVIKAGSDVTAGTLSILSVKGAHIGQNTDVAAGSISILSTGDLASSDAGIDSGSSVNADDLWISASRTAKIGQNTLVSVSGDLVVESTADATGSLAIVKSGADVIVGGSMDLTSGNKATIGQNTTLDVVGNLHMEAAAPAKCTVNNSAVITAGSTSGNCLP